MQGRQRRAVPGAIIIVPVSINIVPCFSPCRVYVHYEVDSNLRYTFTLRGARNCQGVLGLIWLG